LKSISNTTKSIRSSYKISFRVPKSKKTWRTI